MKNNFLFNHLCEVQKYSHESTKTQKYNESINKNKINKFYHECVQNDITLQNVIIELYFCITENMIEEFKETFNVDDFDKLCLLTLSMFYVDYIKYNKNPISDRIASITDFMFEYVSKFEPLIYQLKDKTEVTPEVKKEVKIKIKKTRFKIPIMSSPDLIMFDSVLEAQKYYGCNIYAYIDNGKKNPICGQTFRKIKKVI